MMSVLPLETGGGDATTGKKRGARPVASGRTRDRPLPSSSISAALRLDAAKSLPAANASGESPLARQSRIRPAHFSRVSFVILRSLPTQTLSRHHASSCSGYHDPFHVTKLPAPGWKVKCGEVALGTRTRKPQLFFLGVSAVRPPRVALNCVVSDHHRSPVLELVTGTKLWTAAT